MKEFVSKWSNWWILNPKRKQLDDAFEKELNELIEREVALRQTAVSGSAFSIHDLKCGNILNYDTAEGEILPTVIDWQDLKWLTEDPKGFNLVHSPIRLDKDNVKKLGFEFFHKHNLGYKGESEDLFLSDWTGCIEVFYRGELLDIQFVHELQNFYYCLTGVMLSLS